MMLPPPPPPPGAGHLKGQIFLDWDSIGQVLHLLSLPGDIRPENSI